MFAHVVTFNAYRRMLAIDACRRVKAGRRIELGGETSGGPSRQPLILFIALPWTDDKTEPG
jgi:hypothetical protein